MDFYLIELKIWLLFILFSTVVVTAESNVLVVEAEDSSIAVLNASWKTIESDGLISITASQSGSMLTVDFFGTEFYLIAKTDDHGVNATLEVDGISKGNVSIGPGNEVYQQIKLIEGLDNTYHTIRITILSGTLTIDKFVMGSPTEIPSPEPKVPEDYYTRARYNRPWIFQDSDGIYRITMEVQSRSQYGDIYITNSKDGIVWSRPVPAVTGIYHDYDSATVEDSNGEFWMVFTRIEPPDNRSGFRSAGSAVNTPYYTHSIDGVTWDEPKRIAIAQDNAYYPYLYYDRDSKSFIYLYASSSIENNEFHDNVYISESKSLANPGLSRKITDNSMKSSYYPTIIKDGKGEYWLYFVSPMFEDKAVFLNHNDIFVMHSSDLMNWSKPSLVTDGNKSVAYNYLHPVYRNGMYYLAIMSSQRGTEDAYIMQSKDGLSFTKPARMINRSDINIIDYKSITADRYGKLWMAYSKVMDDESRAVYVVNSSDGITWNVPVRVSPESNIFGELWLVSEPKPESIKKLETANTRAGSTQHSGFNTAWIVLLLMFFLAVVKKRMK